MEQTTDLTSSGRTIPCERYPQLLAQLPGWECHNGQLHKAFTFRNYCETMAFVNAIAWIAHRQDHHPDLEVGYNSCRVRYTTHHAGGLTDIDFMCAAKVDSLVAL